MFWASQVAQCKKSTCNAGDSGLIPGSGRSPGGEHGNPLQYSCWEIPWTEEPGGLQSIESQESDRTERLNIHRSVCSTSCLVWICCDPLGEGKVSVAEMQRRPHGPPGASHPGGLQGPTPQVPDAGVRNSHSFFCFISQFNNDGNLQIAYRRCCFQAGNLKVGDYSDLKPGGKCMSRPHTIPGFQQLEWACSLRGRAQLSLHQFYEKFLPVL